MLTLKHIIVSMTWVFGSLSKPAPFSDFTNNVVFEPTSAYTGMRTLYAHTLQLKDGSLLMTWENYREEPPKVNFLIYRSTDGGANWKHYSTIEDTVNGWGMRWHPHLYALPEAFAGYPAGTILAGGTSVPADKSKTYIDLYISTDQGKTWKFKSHIAYGDGPAPVTDTDASAVWEPFFLLYKGQLLCYYSDQRDPKHSQKLVYSATNNMKTWLKPVDVVVDDSWDGRPGMAVASHIKPIDKWIVTFEHCQPGGCPVEYKIADSPLKFIDSPYLPLKSNDTDATQPFGGPYNTWVPNPQRPDGPGLILANGASDSGVFVNERGGDPTGWKRVDVGQDASYSRSLRIVTLKGKKKLFLGGSGLIFIDGNRPAAGITPIPT